MSNTEINAIIEAFEAENIYNDAVAWGGPEQKYIPTDSSKYAANVARAMNLGFQEFKRGYQACEQLKQAEIDRLHSLAYAVDQGEGGEKVTYKEMLICAENLSAAWKLAFDAARDENERLKSELEKLRNE